MPNMIRVKHQVDGREMIVTEDVFKLWRPKLFTKLNKKLPNMGFVKIGEAKLSPEAMGVKGQVTRQAEANATNRAAQILSDAKAEAERILNEAKAKAAEAPADEVKVNTSPEADLSELKRVELDAMATELGLNPEDYSNREKITAAIEAAKA